MTYLILNSFRPFQNDKYLALPNWKSLRDDNFAFDENGGNFSGIVENAVEKGETARYEHFLLFPQCFQKTCTRKNSDLFRKGLRVAV